MLQVVIAFVPSIQLWGIQWPDWHCWNNWSDVKFYIDTFIILFKKNYQDYMFEFWLSEFCLADKRPTIAFLYDSHIAILYYFCYWQNCSYCSPVLYAMYIHLHIFLLKIHFPGLTQVYCLFLRRLFWTNWNDHQPAIQTVQFNGHNAQSIISDDIRTPNGLTIDYAAQKLYWSDARLDKIERCDYDGSNRVVSCAFSSL